MAKGNRQTMLEFQMPRRRRVGNCQVYLACWCKSKGVKTWVQTNLSMIYCCVRSQENRKTLDGTGFAVIDCLMPKPVLLSFR